MSTSKAQEATTTTLTISYSPARDYLVSIQVPESQVPRKLSWLRSLNHSGIRINGLYPYLLGF